MGINFVRSAIIHTSFFSDLPDKFEEGKTFFRNYLDLTEMRKNNEFVCYLLSTFTQDKIQQRIYIFLIKGLEIKLICSYTEERKFYSLFVNDSPANSKFFSKKGELYIKKLLENNLLRKDYTLLELLTLVTEIYIPNGLIKTFEKEANISKKDPVRKLSIKKIKKSDVDNKISVPKRSLSLK
jgi:hypothetical protein